MTVTAATEVEPATGTPERTTSVDGVVSETTEGQETAATTTTKPPKKFPVIELFGPVIQGEGTQAGQQTMFVRFGGCDFRCAKCDSMHALEPAAIQKHATYMTTNEIVSALNIRADETGVRWVTFSGGNPCMHKLTELVMLLVEEGWLINVETQGSIYQDWLQYVHLVTVSPKSMGMGEAFNPADFKDFLISVGPRPVCIKVPVFYEADLEMCLAVEEASRQAIAEMGFLPTDNFGYQYYMSLGNPFPPKLNKALDLESDEPEGGLVRLLLNAYRRLSEEVLQDPRLKSWRFLPQLHVLIYGNEVGR